MEKKHAIIIIKNDKGEYLQYFDRIWNSYLFLNCKITDEFDYKKIIADIKEKYNINIKSMKLVMDKVHSKFSLKDKIIKEYHHYFYVAHSVYFDSDKEDFKYFSYDQLLNDKRIQEVNSDIVSFVGEIDYDLGNEK